MAGKLRKSAEDYLEAMLMMKEQHGFIRSVDVSGFLHLHRSRPEDRKGGRLPRGARPERRDLRRHLPLRGFAG